VIAGLLVAGVLFLNLTSVRGVITDERSTRVAMSTLQFALSLHTQEYGQLPAESSAASVLEILCGKNPRKLSFYSAAPDQVRDGQLLDSWGHPLLFQKTPGNMLIRSAGKDGLYYTPDDLTLDALASKPAKAE
jgi:type II secretory pathway pseudopilin PulG